MSDATSWPHCDVPRTVPVLFLKSTVLFPLQVVSIQVAQKPNLELLRRHPDPDEILGAGLSLDPDDSYVRRNLGPIGVACRVLSRIEMSRGTAQIVVQGLRRIRLTKVVAARPFFRAQTECVDEPPDTGPIVRERVGEVIALLESLVKTDDRYSDELVRVIRLNLQDGSRCADLIADKIQFGYAAKRRVLETVDVASRLGLVADLLRREVARSGIAREVQAKTEFAIDRTQRKAFLREELEIIRRELEDLDPAEPEIAELEARIAASSMPPLVAEQARREAQALRESSVRESEGASVRAYIDWVLSLPWGETTKDRIDLRAARRALDERYFDLGGARDRLLEFLAVRKLGGSTGLPLLAILGPPGTGRTSLARTLAEVLGRRFVRISMRGILDGTELHGLRRGEAGARPGRILDGLREAGARNAMILIEHIDRLEPRGGAPTVAILNALDPARNHQFRDRYLGVPFDLSHVLFVITANIEEDIPDALWPFLYTIELSGYTERIKLAIARENIWPRVREEHGIAGAGVRLTSAALRRIIREYTRETGVRELQARLETLCRRIAVKIATRRRRISVSARNLEDYLGKPVFTESEITREAKVGAVTGLAWTEAGGILLPIEALLMPGDGFIILTGLLGEVMQESAEAALSYVRSRAEELGIPPGTFHERDLHIHFPEGGIPKDGPSAGISVATTIASLASGRAVRADLAMTGEISLQGRVLAVGGLREKVLAAYRAGIKRVILPRSNESDLAELPAEVRSKMRLHLVSDVAEVFTLALKKKPAKKAVS